MRSRTQNVMCSIFHLLLATFLVSASLALFARPIMAQGDKQDCEEIKQDVNILQDELVNVSSNLGVLQVFFDKADRALQNFDNSPAIKKILKNESWGSNETIRGELLETRRKIVLTRGKIKNQLEDLKLTIQALKDTLADLLNKLGDCGAKQREETTGPKTKSSPSPISGAIDSCLVGTWRADSLVSNIGYSYKGGAGIVLTIKPDGLETIDYNGMKPIEGNGETHLWRGIVEAYFTTSRGTATVTKAGKTDLTVKQTYRDGRTSDYNTKALGPAALGNYPPDRSYTCDGTTLKFKGVAFTSTFTREKK